MRHKVSVVSCTWNRSRQMWYGIRSLIHQSYPPHEIVLVDDGSTDDTKDVVKVLEEMARSLEVEFQYIYLDHPEARISSYPRNVGLKKATYDIVVFSEPECLHIGDTIRQIKDYLEANPDTVPIASQIWTMGQSIWNKMNDHAQDYLSRPETILTHKYAQLMKEGQAHNLSAPDSDWAITGSNNCFAGCFFGTWKDALLDVGGFDESFEGHGWDDWDLIHRLNKKGLKTSMLNDIRVIHQWHRKEYPYNVYDAAEKNGKASEDRIKSGEYRANIGKDWGVL